VQGPRTSGLGQKTKGGRVVWARDTAFKGVFGVCPAKERTSKGKRVSEELDKVQLTSTGDEEKMNKDRNAKKTERQGGGNVSYQEK